MAYVSVSEIFSSLNEEDFRNYLSGCGNGAEADDIMSALKEIRSLKGKTPDRGVFFIFFHYDDTRERYFHETRREKLLSEIFSPRHTDFTRIVCRKPVTSVMWRNAHALDFNNEHTTLLNITVNCYI